MKNLFALLAALMLVSFYANAQQVDYCADEASGTFCVNVEEGIDVTGPEGDICLGDVCPGCSFVIPEEDCMGFTVTGGEDCWIHVMFNGENHPTVGGETYETEESSQVYLVGYWQYWDNGLTPNWETFDNTSEHWSSNIWPLDDPNTQDDPNEVQFRVCGTIYATCYAEAGQYTIDLGLTANYVCGVI